MKVTVEFAGERLELQVNPGPTLLEYLQTESIPVNAACGGRGSCNKCRVQVTQGFAAANSLDQKAFTADEIQKGWRLSCQLRPRTNLQCRLPNLESTKKKARVRILKEQHADQDFVNPRIVVDLGSTGVAAALLDEKKGVIAESHLLNQQVLIGADVMSRLHYIQQNGLDRAQELLRASFHAVVAAFDGHFPQAKAAAVQHPILFSGNSVMVSIFHGWDLSTLAVAPFRPIQLHADSSRLPSGWVAESLPLLGGFVGADALACAFDVEDRFSPSKPWALIDIGTNTEIIIRNQKGEYFYSSAPAGPAFEGGNILCGMRGEPGAISRAHYRNGGWDLETVAGDRIQGICGSGLFDLMAESVAASLIQKDGFLPGGALHLTPEIKLIADDVREFQLAKAATRTAYDILCDRASVQPETIYLAGTFAEHLRLDSVDAVGLLPSSAKKVVLGNASLEGLSRLSYRSAEERKKLLSAITNKSIGVELALETDFQERFVQNINF